MIEIYKHFHLYDKHSLPPTFQHQTRTSRKHNFQILWKSPKDGIRGLQTNSFYYRTMSTWNNLPRNVVDAQNLNTFKNRLDEYWEESPVKYNDTINDDE